ncbi:receptor-like protein 13 [Gossypium hirsutum]|uniref:Receptor-like protein 13 n=1 Tax=Gossypium hirsutum TaxID=3635 RepID=A0ABM2ZDK7_GOSHI|nr:receptor-like protein 13 [Gossypium hirsutum]
MLENLTSLEYLDISFHSFFGDIIVLKNLTSLEYLDLSSNKFSGNISHLKSLTSLRELRLSKNKIEIPSSLALLFNISKLQKLYADNNMIYNAETEMHSLDTPTFQLRSITLSCCGDGGSFPQSLNHQHDLEYVDLSNINFKGYQFPNWLLENNKKLKELHLANSSLSGHFQLPPTSHRGLLYLDVSNNSLNGNIPNEIGAKVPSLELLNMSNNFFGGGIPISIGDNNHFEGGIPVQLCKLNRLRLIDVSNNNLSGTIPPCLMNSISNDSSHAYYSDYDYNGYIGSFSADVPVEVTMKSISYFYRGRVLTYLSGIDLSCNKLTGEIPLQSRTDTLSVAYNNLLGTTPQTTGQFATFEESSYVGNPFLCGEPLPKNCSTDESSSSMPRNATDEGFLDMKVFCASFVGSYIVMPLCIAIVLYINPYWRQAWFYHVEAATMSYYYFVLDNTLPKRFR